MTTARPGPSVAPLASWVGADAVTGPEAAWRAFAWAIGLVLACTAVDRLLVPWLGEANLVMVYLLGVLLVALRGHPAAALTAAVLAVFAFDFFFVPPYFSFAVSDTPYLITFLGMGLVGGVISTLTARLVAEVSATRTRERQARALYDLSCALLPTQAPEAILAAAVRVVGEQLGEPVAAWLRGEPDVPVPVVAPDPPLSPSEEAILRWALRAGDVAGPGTGTFPGAGCLFLPVGTAGHVHAVLAVRVAEGPAGPIAPAPAVRSALDTVVNQLTVALDQARAREDAEAAHRQADAERVRSSLLAAVSHDLRTPLTGIMGAAGTLVQGVDALPTETRIELARGIEEEAERLSRLIASLLLATRLDAGAVRVARLPFDLEEAVGAALSRLSGVLADHPVTVEVPATLPPVPGDAALVEQVFANLLENAAKHTPAGTAIAVSAGVEGDRLWAEVADRGPGLPPGEEARAFEKFRRYPGAGPGAGLGLAICTGLVQAHGGAIAASQRPGGGAAFRFWLPLAGPAAAAPAPDATLPGPWPTRNP